MEKEFSPEVGLSIESQVELAQALSDAVDARENFTQGMGGFDDFAAVHQYVDGNRETYDKLDDEAQRARKELAEKVADKKTLVAHLRASGNTKLADRISRMFSVK